jgi:hypothetical protein
MAGFERPDGELAGTTDCRGSAVVLPFPRHGERASGVRDVERIDQYAFYELGKALRQAASPVGETLAGHCVFDIVAAEGMLLRLIERDEPVPIRVSVEPARQLLARLSTILDEHVRPPGPDGKPSFKFPDKDARIESYQFDWVRTKLANFETVFHEEMRDAATYYVPRRGIFWTPGLVDTADDTFPKELVQVVPEKAKVEWRAAGRCLAFNLLSASGFHVARAVEGTLESYYQVFCGKPGDTLRSWHDYIEALDKAEQGTDAPKPAAKTLSELRQMKDDYRNPIMHPRVVLDEPDARMLFANGESLIIAMAQELAAAAGNGVQSSLALVMKEAGDGMA